MHSISLTQARDSHAAPGAATCHNCPARTRCLPDGADGASLDRLERSVACRLSLARHEVLFRRGESGCQLYAIREGQFKTQRGVPNGASQVLGFYMSGELLGLEALDDGRYGCDAVALTDSVMCVLPYAPLTRLLAQESRLQLQFHHLMSSEIARQQATMLMLGNTRAPQRLAAFLLEQSVRCQLRGESGIRFQLRMSREDIATYLGLTAESISRLLSAFQHAGAMHVSNRAIELLAPDWLRQIVRQTAPAGSAPQPQ
ncbi:MAG: cyclic nucleotide-binding domain-containing protein [Pseudomonadota bacterium]